MAAKKKARTRSKAQETTLRHLWLAGLGAVAVMRREARNAASDAVAKVESLKLQAGKLANDAQANVRGGIASVREQGEVKANQFSADVEARLAPVLVKLGLKPKAGKVVRKRKPANKPSNQAVARRARAAAARKPVAKRAVRKARR